MKDSLITLLLFTCTIIISIASLFVGVIGITPAGLAAGNFDQFQIMLISRLPRLLAILCTGIGMSATFREPLWPAEPQDRAGA